MSTVIFEQYDGAAPTAADIVLPLVRCFGVTTPPVEAFAEIALQIECSGTAGSVVQTSGAIALPTIQVFGSTFDAMFGYLKLPAVDIDGFVGSTHVITATWGYVATPLLGGSGSAAVVVVANGSSVLPSADMFGMVGNLNVGAIQLPQPTVRGYVPPPAPTAWAVLSQSHGFMWADTAGVVELIVELAEYVSAGSITESGFLITLRERLGIANTPVSILATAIALEDTLAIRDVLQYALHVVLGETLDLADTATLDRSVLVRIVDRLVLTGTAVSVMDAQITLASALVLGDEVAAPFLAALIEELDLGETLDVQVSRLAALIETVYLDATASTGMMVAVAVDESLLLDDATTTSLAANVLLREALECFGTLSINGDVWSCWIINTESKGVARYTHYPFNSFAVAPWGAYVGATDTGLYTLGGGTDDGTPITARIRSALTDFGDRRAKRVPSMYIGYTADGQIGLKVAHTSTTTGQKVEDHYLLEPRNAGDVRENRFKIGRGIASVYLGFELVNVAGADFALDVVEWMPIRIDRRVR